MKIILGSASKSRQEILKSMGFDFEVVAANIDEKTIRSDDFRHLPMLLAKAKSQELQNQIKEPAILITSDFIAVHKNQLREKPASEEEAREFLRGYGLDPIEVSTAVYLINTQTGISAEGRESAKVYFHKIPDTVIDDLIKHGAVMQAAGAFIAEMPAIRKYIIHLEGNMDTVMGLPGFLTRQLIDEVLR